MKTTKRRGTDFTFLKLIIIGGSLLATLIGSDLLAKQTNGSATTGNNPLIESAPVRSDVNLGEAPMVRLIIPEPITNSQSSQ